MKQNHTDRFIDSLFELANEKFPERVVIQAKRCLLDYIGVALAGAEILKNKDYKLLDLFGSFDGSSTLIGLKRKTTIQNAVLMNGLNSHVAELDDGIRFGVMHPGTAVFSALLPLTELESLSGDRLLKGIILGYEGAIRIANALQPSHRERGFHTTGTCGTIGATIGIGFALDFTKEQLKSALTAAITSASGLLKVMKDGSDLKPFNAANAALNGLHSASMARAGFTGADELLAGKWGFMTMMSDEIDWEKFEQKNSTFRIEQIYVKPYAACRHCHPAIEAALKIKNSNIFHIEDIKEINVITYNAAKNSHDHIEINGITSAKMSTPFSVAVALHTGKAGINEFDSKYVNDEKILATNRKVKVSASEDLSKLVPNKRVAIVEINTIDNEKFIERVDFPKGEPENSLTLEELKEKFVNLAQYSGKSFEECNELIHIVMDIENKIHLLFDFLR